MYNNIYFVVSLVSFLLKLVVVVNGDGSTPLSSSSLFFCCILSSSLFFCCILTSSLFFWGILLSSLFFWGILSSSLLSCQTLLNTDCKYNAIITAMT
ncbi:hypothetical protein Lalb_Chr19g0132001 [Lupinus albus]|uniref:Uncharacterized protein n=1 Tax=Lupinus albus TaxID=3870 RepID=A0A6A4NZA5_LUPAL|nr:hypothetical protein Lalb_Chr19g0132001 [Lupinus albus]